MKFPALRLRGTIQCSIAILLSCAYGLFRLDPASHARVTCECENFDLRIDSSTSSCRRSCRQLRFPSVDCRVKLYMGTWYSKKPELNWSVPDICNLTVTPSTDFKAPIFTYLPAMVTCSRGELKVSSLMKNYCRDILSFFQPPMDGIPAILKFGDSTRFPDLPVVAKVGFISSDYEGSSGRNSIVWPLNKERHFAGMQEVRGVGPQWDKKHSTLIWRGTNTGMRRRSPEITTRAEIVKMYYNSSADGIDIAFSHVILPGGENLTIYQRPGIPRAQLLDYKYLLSLEGNDVASGLKWMLYSDSVVFMAKPKFVSWAMESELKAFVHYVPVHDNFSNLPKMVAWARLNDEVCQRISRRASLFIHDLLFHEDAGVDEALVMRRMRELYSSQFGTDLVRAYEGCGNM
jgi:hypothetical protein